MFLLFSFLFFARQRFGLFLLSLLLSLSVREEVALSVWLFGFYALLLKRKWPWVVSPIALSLVWWYCSTELILARSQIAMEGLDQFFASFGKGRNEILATVMREPDKFIDIFLNQRFWEYFYEMVKPTTFLSLGAVLSLFALPTIAMNGLIGAFWPSMINVANHYSLIGAVSLFAAFPNAVAWLAPRINLFRLRREMICLGLCGLTIPAVAIGVKDILQYGGGKDQALAHDFVLKPFDPTLREIVNAIEPQAGVAAPGILLPALSYRPKLYYSQALWRYHHPEFEYIIVETDRHRIGARGCDREKYELLIRDITESAEYSREFTHKEFEVYRKIGKVDPVSGLRKYICSSGNQNSNGKKESLTDLETANR